MAGSVSSVVSVAVLRCSGVSDFELIRDDFERKFKRKFLRLNLRLLFYIIYAIRLNINARKE